MKAKETLTQLPSRWRADIISSVCVCTPEEAWSLAVAAVKVAASAAAATERERERKAEETRSLGLVCSSR